MTTATTFVRSATSATTLLLLLPGVAAGGVAVESPPFGGWCPARTEGGVRKLKKLKTNKMDANHFRFKTAKNISALNKKTRDFERFWGPYLTIPYIEWGGDNTSYVLGKANRPFMPDREAGAWRRIVDVQRAPFESEGHSGSHVRPKEGHPNPRDGARDGSG